MEQITPASGMAPTPTGTRYQRQLLEASGCDNGRSVSSVYRVLERTVEQYAAVLQTCNRPVGRRSGKDKAARVNARWCSSLL